MAGIARLHYMPTWSSSRNIEERCLTETPSERLQVMFEKVCRDFQAQLVEMNGEAEHVHLLIHLPAKALRVELGQQPQRGFQSPTL